MLRTPHNLLFTTLLLGALAAVTPVQAAASKVTSNAPAGSNKSSPAAASVNVAPAAMVIPKSQFGALPESGKDPFYPDSARLQKKISVSQTNNVATVAPEVRINGFSGNATRPLVIINNVTFGEGDEQMVTTAAGRARVRCVEIRTQDQAVEIEINGQRRELKFVDRK